MIPTSVLQAWVQRLSFMQQSVLISAVRGPDTLPKDHVAKFLMRWYRRCVLYSAFESGQQGMPVSLTTPEEDGGGSFTGPVFDVRAIAQKYLYGVDVIPHHFHLHLVHAAEILGYKHPEPFPRTFWRGFYIEAVNDMHLRTETEEEMDIRLGDSETAWRAREAFPAGAESS